MIKGVQCGGGDVRAGLNAYKCMCARERGCVCVRLDARACAVCVCLVVVDRGGGLWHLAELVARLTNESQEQKQRTARRLP